MAMTRRERIAAAARRRIARSATPLEDELWQGLRRLPGHGGGFGRQERLGPYLLDFVSDRLGLIIEVDGAQHARPVHRARDAARDLWLSQAGYRVLRFPNEDVRLRLPAVLDTIRAVAEERRVLPPAERPRAVPPVQGRPRPRPRPG